MVEAHPAAAVGADADDGDRAAGLGAFETVHGRASLDERDHQVEDSDEEDLSTAHSAAQSILNKLNAMKGIVKGRLRIGMDRGVTTVRFNDFKLVDESEIAAIRQELCDNLNKNALRVLLDMKNVRKLSSGAVVARRR